VRLGFIWRLQGIRQSLLRVAARRGITLTQDDLARIARCVDEATLERWLDNAIEAKTASDVFS
jgi:hypothetical protein